MSILSRWFGRAPADPGEEMIEFLSDKSLDDRRIVVGILYGGPYSQKVVRWVLSRPDCDKGTAVMLLWNYGLPHSLVRGPDKFPLSDEIKRELIGLIVDRWKDGLFAPAVFEWDTREATKIYRRELRKKGLQGQDPFGIPEEAWQPVQGRRPEGSPATDYHARGSRLADLMGALRLADLAAINPADWESIRRRSLRLD
jgi:hypothetical protein